MKSTFRGAIAASSLALVLAIPAVVADAATTAPSAADYALTVRNSSSGGDPGYFYEGGPLDITVKKRTGTSTARISITMTPHRIGSSSVIHGRVGRTIFGPAPSRAGKTRFVVTLDGTDVVLRRTITVRAAHG